MLEIGRVNRINSAEDHRMDFLETGQRFPRGLALVCDGIANFDIGGAFDVSDEIAHVARFEPGLHQHLRRKHTYFLDLIARVVAQQPDGVIGFHRAGDDPYVDRKSTRLNSSHPSISYAVFCLKKKKKYY